jgi:multicomponent Na+:H+ antiporter subunit D
MNAVWPHLPILQVIVPLLGAVVTAFLRRGVAAFGVALAVSWVLPFISGALLWETLTSGPVSYHLGGWAPPWGIEYRVDVLGGFVLMLVSSVGAVIMPYARRSVSFEIGEERQAWFYCMYLLCLAGLLGITVTGDAFNAFVFMEISELRRRPAGRPRQRRGRVQLRIRRPPACGPGRTTSAHGQDRSGGQRHHDSRRRGRGARG